MKRSAPESGYVGGAKDHYRRDVWAEAKRIMAYQSWPRRESHVLLMPSAEGREIEIAMQAGFAEWNLHVVDKNPAIVAHLKRRFPRINTYGVVASVAAARIARAGVKLRFANLDLCGNLSEATCGELFKFGRTGCVDDHGYVAITMLRGREKASDYAGQIIRDGERDHVFESFAGRIGCSKNDTKRIAVSMMAISGALNVERREADRNVQPNCYLRRVGRYRSTAGSQTMLWWVMQLRRSGVEEAAA